MPFVNDGSGDLVQQALALSQLVQARRERQGKNVLDLAKPGDTFESIGMDPKTFQALYGKNTKFDPKRVVSELTPDALLGRNLVGYIQTLGPRELANMSATLLNQKEGIPGATTREGRLAAQESGGRQAQLVDQVTKETFEADKGTAVAKAKTGLIQAESAKLTAEDVAARVMEGINAWKGAPAETQTAMNQRLALGTTPTQVSQDEFKAKLATSAMRQALLAQTDPKHPMHGFLQKFGLNLNTVLAGSAMGIDTMFTDYARFSQQMGLAGKEESNILLRMYTDTAKEMSKSIFNGKLSPGQVLTMIKSREDGTPLPKGMEAAAAVYDRAVDAGFSANMQEALEKGDPFLQGLNQSIQALGKITDPGSMDMVVDMRRRAAAYAATMHQMGQPKTEEETNRFNALMKKNYQRALSVKYDAPWFGSNKWVPTGPDQGAAPPPDLGGLPDAVKGAMAPRAPAPGASMPTGLNVKPVAGAPLDPKAAIGGLPEADQQALLEYIQSLGAGVGPPKPPPPQ